MPSKGRLGPTTVLKTYGFDYVTNIYVLHPFHGEATSCDTRESDDGHIMGANEDLKNVQN